MKKKKLAYIDMRIHPAMVTFGGQPVNIRLPQGCIGMTFIWSDKKSAKSWSKYCQLLKVELDCSEP